MSKTIKDLKSHKKGFGKYGFNKPTRKLTPFNHEANKIAGKNEVLMGPPDNDISMDNFQEHGHSAKSVRSIRKKIRRERDIEKTTARSRIKRKDKKDFENLD